MCSINGVSSKNIGSEQRTLNCALLSTSNVLTHVVISSRSDERFSISEAWLSSCSEEFLNCSRIVNSKVEYTNATNSTGFAESIQFDVNVTSRYWRVEFTKRKREFTMKPTNFYQAYVAEVQFHTVQRSVIFTPPSDLLEIYANEATVLTLHSFFVHDMPTNETGIDWTYSVNPELLGGLNGIVCNGI